MSATEVAVAGRRLGIAVIGGEIYGAHRGPGDSTVWVRMVDPTTMARGTVAHAVTEQSIRSSVERRRKTFDTTCGVRAYPRLYVQARRDDAEELDVVLAPWPPRVGDFPDGTTRCGDCYRAHPKSLRAWDGLYRNLEDGGYHA